MGKASPSDSKGILGFYARASAVKHLGAREPVSRGFPLLQWPGEATRTRVDAHDRRHNMLSRYLTPQCSPWSFSSVAAKPSPHRRVHQSGKENSAWPSKTANPAAAFSCAISAEESWNPFGGCLIDGTVERPDWLARVQETGSHPLWANSPVATSLRTGTTLEVVNVGGRGHSFTRVENFGGGRLPLLNTREDTQIPAPECLGEEVVLIPGAGGSVTTTFTGIGEQHYQCCFHPWMRTTVEVTQAEGN